ncbi:hypothetical protein [Pedobacter cryoconitis]|uniref:Uncharacterized protein n=1 Tax=Pedobacter cryoconitis TaxID=188932 RepID=A0A7X0J0F0_9SPHI|nr:hypothetical protein [Pedobacter cryoconitis]MBB6498779.1 hypothetical protein [Pedobacter cryoconitis]
MKIFALFAGLVLLYSCSKDPLDVNDKTVYKWQRSMYRQALPAPTSSNFSSTQLNNYTILLKTDYVFLTSLQAKAQKDSIKNASGSLFTYTYQKQ